MTSDRGRAGGFMQRQAAAVVIAAVHGYQILISPWLGRNCRFQPTCSTYCIEAVRRYGVGRGLLKAARRVARCHPWSRGGYDPP
jgi:putative membrane protein insertion efficiency factor